MRKSKRDIERAVDSMDTTPQESGVVVAYEKDGVWVDRGGTPLEELTFGLCIKMGEWDES